MTTPTTPVSYQMSNERAKERWAQLTERGEYGPNPCTLDPWRSFYVGWLEGGVDAMNNSTPMRSKAVRKDAILGAFILGILVGAIVFSILAP